MADITPVHKKNSKSAKDNYRPVIILLQSPKCINGSCLNKCQNNLKVFFSLNINVDLERVLVVNTV